VCPTIKCDIREWMFEPVLAPGSVDIVWASPPCTEYSKAKSRGVRDLETADSLVSRALTIIAALRPSVWIVENPATGKLPDRFAQIMRDTPGTEALQSEGWREYRVSYCSYGAGYRKQTSLWSNANLSALRQCAGPYLCPAMRRHPATGRWRHERSAGNHSAGYHSGVSLTAYDKCVIPPPLIDHLMVILSSST
jgi:C-5 cytosine-specific DNA methylase